MLFISAVLLTAHARAVMEVQDISIPLVADLPELERRLSVLTNQVEMGELHAMTRVGSQEERVNVFVLPTQPDFDRLMAIFDIFRDSLEREGLIADVSDITLDDPVQREDLVTRAVTMTFDAHQDGIEKFLSVMKLSGLLTIGDALTAQERRILLERTEAENPAGITALEQFLSTDLLRYARDSHSYEQQLLRSFSSPEFVSTFQDTLRLSFLRDARRILNSEIGRSIDRFDLWPFPFLIVNDIRLETGGAPGWYAVNVEMDLYSRG